VTAHVINLTAAADACRPLIAWWRRWEATGIDDPAGLDDAFRHLAACPPLEGPLGRVIATLDRSTLNSQPRAVLVAALAQLARLAEIREQPGQLVLPGLYLPCPPKEPEANDLERAPGPEPTSPPLEAPVSHLASATAAVPTARHQRDLGSASSTQPATQDPHGIDR